MYGQWGLTVVSVAITTRRLLCTGTALTGAFLALLAHCPVAADSGQLLLCLLIMCGLWAIMARVFVSFLFCTGMVPHGVMLPDQSRVPVILTQLPLFLPAIFGLLAEALRIRL